MTFLKYSSTVLISLVICLAILFSTGCVSTGGSGSEPDIRTSVEAEPPTEDPNIPVSSDDPTPTSQPALPEGEVNYDLAPVDNIDILMMESFPVQIRVMISGNLPDGCSQIDEAQVTREDDTFHIELTTRRLVDKECTEALVPYEEYIPLDVVGLPAGKYTVEVNGVTEAFTLIVDNVQSEAMLNC